MSSNHTENVQNRNMEDKQRTLLDKFLGAIIKTLFVVGSSALILDSVRNSLTWYLGKFWGDAGSAWQEIWTNILALTGEDDYVLLTFWLMVVTHIAFYGIGSLYTLMDITNKPTFLRKYKIQPGTNEPVEKSKLQNLFVQIVFNTFIVTGACVYGPFAWLRSWRLQYKPLVAPQKYEVNVLPEFHWVLIELAVCVIVEEFLFYYCHRMLHHKRIYKYIHKKHHEWTASISWVAVYSNPIEHIFSNIVPIYMGTLVCGSHVATIYLWNLLAILNTLNAHSGYHFPFFPSPEAHDYHHLKFNQCYGVLGILDYLHGTDIQFRESKAYQRHVLSVSTTPLRETFPDEDNCKLVEKEKQLKD